MKVEELPIAGLKLISPRVFGDERGWFYESFNVDKMAELGITHGWDQDNHSRSVQNTIRALHFQSTPGQAKLVRCTLGAVWDVAVDLRSDSPTFGQWHGVELTGENQKMLYIPAGFAHGFCVLSEVAEFQYKCSTVYDGDTETGIAWDDPDIGVKWPITDPLLSERDQQNQSFKQWVERNPGAFKIAR
ncbi:MAG: dTDP-4-dehydrorhamnose 3,5-epimerase [Fibrobacter sp.]|nr:dTDP-4-dehydrorhamnose 3,5-epimerase [Fibrobacter sp.]